MQMVIYFYCFKLGVAEMWQSHAAKRWEISLSDKDALDFVEDMLERFQNWPNALKFIQPFHRSAPCVDIFMIFRVFLIKRDYFPGAGRDDENGFVIGRYARSKISKTILKPINPIDQSAARVVDWPIVEEAL